MGKKGFGQCDVERCGYRPLNYERGILPTFIEDLKDFKIDAIGCGHEHSYIRTEYGKHYLFGRNHNNECLQMYQDCDYVSRPSN